jgi:hypothetical protein
MKYNARPPAGFRACPVCTWTQAKVRVAEGASR